MATVVGEVRNSGLFRTRSMPIFQLTVGQGRARLRCLWFNATYLQDKFKPGQMIALYGKVEEDQRSRELQIVQPQFEILGDGEEGSATKKPLNRSRSAASSPSTKPPEGASLRAGFAAPSAPHSTISRLTFPIPFPLRCAPIWD